MKNVLIFVAIIGGIGLFIGPAIYDQYLALSGEPTEVRTEESKEEVTKRSVVYSCADDKKFLAQYVGRDVEIQMPDGKVVLLKEYRTDSSGTWFKQDSKDVYMFVNGLSGFVTDKGADVYEQCVATTT